jgi:hypothetical protein
MINETNFDAVMEDFTKELQAIKDAVKVLPAKVEDLTKKVDGFKNKVDNLRVIGPKPDLVMVNTIVAEGFATVNHAVHEQLLDLFTKNRILVLPEDGGKRFLRIIRKRFMILAGVIVVAGLACWFGFRYLYMDSENTRFRNYWYWTYIGQDQKGKTHMVSELDSFKVSSINNFRTDSIEVFLKKQAREIRIIQLERDADSLRALKIY